MGHPQTSVLEGLTLQHMVYSNLQNNYQVLQHATETHSEKKIRPALHLLFHRALACHCFDLIFT